MKVAAVSKLKASLSEYLNQVKAGEEVLITEGTPKKIDQKIMKWEGKGGKDNAYSRFDWQRNSDF